MDQKIVFIIAGMRTFLGSEPRLKWNGSGGGRYSCGGHGCGDLVAGGVPTNVVTIITMHVNEPIVVTDRIVKTLLLLKQNNYRNFLYIEMTEWEKINRKTNLYSHFSEDIFNLVH